MTTVGHAGPALVSHRDVSTHLQAVRTVLEQQRRFRIEQLDALNVDSAGPAAAEQKTDDPLREVTMSLRAAATVALADIEAALNRIQDGRYGRCQACHTAISRERLQALPMVSFCMTCQQIREAAGDVPAVAPTAEPRRDRLRVIAATLTAPV